MRPNTRSLSSLKLWMPIEIRFTPAWVYPKKRSASTVPGLASSVISISGKKGIRCLISLNRKAIPCAENRLGVPPPMKIEWSGRFFTL